MYTPFVRLGTTGSYLTQVDSALNANGAVNFSNPLGTLYAPPINEGNTTSTNGYGAPPVLKYVQYLSTANPAPVAWPAPVYWVDETFTIVSGEYTEALNGADSIAGYLLVNTTSVPTLTQAVLTNGGNGVGVWIQIGGFLAGAAAGAAVKSEFLVGSAASNWIPVLVANGTAPGHKMLGMALTAAAGGIADVIVGGLSTFWGS